MKTKTLTVVLLSTLAIAACTTTKKEERAEMKESPQVAATATVKADQLKRGGFLVGIGACNDCHTPMKFDPSLGMPVPQMDRMLSGHPAGAPDPEAQPGKTDQAVIGPTFTSFKLPFGTVYAANLTPDNETGLGLWSEEEFVRALRTGKHRGAASGRPIMPPMPWMNVQANFSEDDLRAVYAYLRAIPPIKNAVPEPNVPPQVYAAMGESYDKVLKKAALPPTRL